MVMYRDSARREAKRLKLVGWVMNQDDGTVEIMAEGEEENLKKLIKWCYNGPVLARIDKIDVKWSEPTGQFNDFEIKY